MRVPHMGPRRRALLLFSDTEKIPSHFIKYIEDDIFEFRVNYSNNEFRIFFIYDGENITLRTLFDIVERGLGGHLRITVSSSKTS